MIFLQRSKILFSVKECLPESGGIFRLQEHEYLESMCLWSEETAQRVRILVDFLPQVFQLLFGLVVNVQQDNVRVPCDTVSLSFFAVSCRDGVEWQLLLHIVCLFRLSLADEQPYFEYKFCVYSLCDVFNYFSQGYLSPNVAESAVCGNRNIFHFFVSCFSLPCWRREVGYNIRNGKNAFFNRKGVFAQY